jgi:hypothetical protein
MIAVMRDKLGPKFIGGVVFLIAFVFIFSGIFMSGSGGLGGVGPSAAGEVNGEVITYTEFNRALNQRIDFFKSMMGGKVTEEQLAQFKIREAVFQDLSQRKLLVQMAKKEGFGASAEEIREKILAMDVFKKDGRFDKVLYKNVLAQNQYTPTRFEELIGQEVLEQNFKSFLSSLAVIMPDEVEQELKKSREKRKLRYVFLDHETIRKSFAKDLKPEEATQKLDQKVESLFQSLQSLVASGKDAAANAILKEYKFAVKTSEWLTAQSDYIGGVGSIRAAQNELFGLKKNAPAKKVALLGGTLIATVADSESYNPSKITAKDRSETASRLQSTKANEISGELMKSWTKKSKIARNDSIVVGGQPGQVMPITAEQ